MASVALTYTNGMMEVRKEAASMTDLSADADCRRSQLPPKRRLSTPCLRIDSSSSHWSRIFRFSNAFSITLPSFADIWTSVGTIEKVGASLQDKYKAGQKVRFMSTLM